MQDKVWIVYGTTESSDEIPPRVFKKEPSEEILRKIAMQADGLESEEECDGPGDYGTYAYLTKIEVEIE